MYPQYSNYEINQHTEIQSSQTSSSNITTNTSIQHNLQQNQQNIQNQQNYNISTNPSYTNQIGNNIQNGQPLVYSNYPLNSNPNIHANIQSNINPNINSNMNPNMNPNINSNINPPYNHQIENPNLNIYNAPRTTYQTPPIHSQTKFYSQSNIIQSNINNIQTNINQRTIQTPPPPQSSFNTSYNQPPPANIQQNTPFINQTNIQNSLQQQYYSPITSSGLTTTNPINTTTTTNNNNINDYKDPRQRIDPNQIPRPPSYNFIANYHTSGHTMTMPPAASSKYIVIDEGCCSPRFIRPTLNHIPQTKEIAKQCALPIAAIISPLANISIEEQPIPMVDFGEQGPLRCNRCNSYINSFSKFINSGKKYICNICNMANDTPRDYYCNIDVNGKRRDLMERPELSKGSVDFIVPKAYTIRPPQKLIYIFIIDISITSIESGFLSCVIESIKQVILQLIETEITPNIGIITYDKHIQYYNINNKNIKITILPDIEDPYGPSPPNSWIMPLNQHKNLIDQILDIILSSQKQILLKNNNNNQNNDFNKHINNKNKNDSCLGAVLKSVSDAISETGGRIFIFSGSVSRVGIGKITREENIRDYGTDKEYIYYTPDNIKNIFYNKLGDYCAEKQISIDLFYTGGGAATFSDIATISQLSTMTGGNVHYYSDFGKNIIQDKKKIMTHLLRSIKNIKGLEGVLKIRCNTGLRVEEIYGHYRHHLLQNGMRLDHNDEIEMTIINSEISIAVTFSHDDDLKENNDVYIQAALLYTTLEGKRCVRVHNLALQVAPLLSNVFRYADLEANCSLLQRTATKLLLGNSGDDSSSITALKNPVLIRENIINKCVDVLYNYRKYCASSSSSGQLILPESLKLLPLYTLATLKSIAFRANSSSNSNVSQIDIRGDDRSFFLTCLTSLPVEHAVSAAYPILYSIHDMPEECGTIGEHGDIILPPALPPTGEKLDENGIYLLYSTFILQIYIGPLVNPVILMDLFGTDRIDSSEQILNIIENNDTTIEKDFKKRLLTIINVLEKKSSIYSKLEIITKNDWRLQKFMNYLIEDRTKNDMSYVEFLCQIHKKIQQKFIK